MGTEPTGQAAGSRAAPLLPMVNSPSPASGPPPAQPPAFRWIKTECGRAKYADLASRPGVLARLRLTWFVLIAALRDWRLPR